LSNPPPGGLQRPGRRAIYARRRLGAALALVMLLAMGFLAWKVYRFWTAPLTSTLGTPGPSPAPDAPVSTRFTVLIMGADDRPDQPGRSDTILLAFVDLNAGQVKLMSVPRDTYVRVPGHGGDRINAAYAYGQEDLVKRTLSPLLPVPIDYTFVVNMQGFQKVVDAVGGVEINIDENMDYDDPYDTPPLHIHLTKGLKTLDGLHALEYVRFRHDAQNDWGRMQRQQTFLKALLKAAEKPGNLLHLPTLIKLGLDNVRTNMSPSLLTRLALLAKDKLGVDGITGTTLAGDDLWTTDGYYSVLHFQEMRDTVRQLAGATPDANAATQDKQDADAYNAAVPKGYSTYAALLASQAPEPVKPPPVKGGGTGPSPAPGPGPGHTPWPLVVVDGTGGAQGKLLETLKANGFEVLLLPGAKGPKGTTIVWYNGPKEAADRLRALVPGAQFQHPAPGPGDPPLKLIMG